MYRQSYALAPARSTGRRWVACHLEPQQLPPAVAQYQKREQSLKRQGRNHKQYGRDRLRVVAEECLPTLRRRSTLHHVFRDRRLGDVKAEHQQLAMDPRCSPLWVFPAHPSDKIAQLATDLWPSCPLPRFPAPERRETNTMPAKGRTPQGDAELMAKEQVLGFKSARRLEEVYKEHFH